MSHWEAEDIPSMWAELETPRPRRDAIREAAEERYDGEGNGWEWDE